MNSIKKAIAATAVAGGLLSATGVFAQDQSAQPQAEMPTQSQEMQGMMEGMGNMQGMMGMMSQMSEMMETCNNMMQAMNDNMDQETPEADGAQPDNG